MKFKILRKKSLKELNKMLFQKRVKLLELRFKSAKDELKGVAQIKALKRDIARLLTAINHLRRDKK